jgi:hypothetical protein
LLKKDIRIVVIEFSFQDFEAVDVGLTGVYNFDVLHPRWRMHVEIYNHVFVIRSLMMP